MAIRATGLKTNDKEIQKFAQRIVEKYVDRYISAGNKAQKEIRRKYTIDWFVNESYAMVDALQFEHKLVQQSGIATIYFTSYVDMGMFAFTTMRNDISIYRWANKYNATINPAEFLLDLQWNRGIHGLPETWSRPNYRFGQSWNDSVNHWKNPAFNQGIPMSEYVRGGFRQEWEETVNRFLKK